MIYVHVNTIAEWYLTEFIMVWDYLKQGSTVSDLVHLFIRGHAVGLRTVCENIMKHRSE